jgi:MFS family permease
MGAIAPSLLALLGIEVSPNRLGRAAGVLQLYGDLGGALGPIVGTELLAHGSATPYLLSAGLLVLVLPIALWLGRRERRRVAGP